MKVLPRWSVLFAAAVLVVTGCASQDGPFDSGDIANVPTEAPTSLVENLDAESIRYFGQDPRGADVYGGTIDAEDAWCLVILDAEGTSGGGCGDGLGQLRVFFEGCTYRLSQDPVPDAGDEELLGDHLTVSCP